MTTNTTTIEGNITYVNTYDDNGKLEYSWATYVSGAKALFDYRSYVVSAIGNTTLWIKEYDAQGRLAFEKITNGQINTMGAPIDRWQISTADFLYKTVDHDELKSNTWIELEKFYSVQALFEHVQYEAALYDDGGVRHKKFVWVELSSGMKLSSDEHRNAQGQKTSLWEYSYARSSSVTGSKHKAWDRGDKQDWSIQKSTFDKDGDRLTLIYSNDDRSLVSYEWDPNGENAFSRIVTQFDTLGQKTSTVYTNDNGSTVMYEHDLAGLSWSRVATYFDAGGTRTKAVYDNDDGTHTAYSWSGGPPAITYYDANWHIL